MIQKLYKDVKFSDLFAHQRAAVVSYLSLEKKYMALHRVHREEMAVARRNRYDAMMTGRIGK
jgi:hypothetical protein